MFFSRISRSVFCAALVILAVGFTAPSAWSKSVEDRLAEVEQAMTEIREIRARLAEQNAQISRMMREVTQMRGELEEFKHGLRSQQALADLEKRIAALEQSRPAGTAIAQPGQPTVPAEQKPVTEDDVFAQAKDLFKKGEMNAARQAFARFQQSYPKSKLTAAAIFWIGETFYFQKQFEEAILEYQKIIQDHPKADKVPSAQLKQAFAFAELKDVTSARILLQRLIKEYPKTAQAAIARRKLVVLKK